MNNKLKVENISFNYTNKEILKNISFECNNKGVIALLGPNGAGKSTLMRILVGLKNPKSGSAKLNDIDIINDNKKAVQVIGYLPQDFQIYGNISGLDFLNYVCDVKGLNKNEKSKEIEFLIEKFNLNKVIKKRFNSYSGGYKRRLGIAQAMIGNPKLLIIDEPTSGLDPEQRFEFRQYLSKLGEDRIILISTHIIEDIEFYCKKILMIKEGKLIFDGLSNEFIKVVQNKIFEGTVSLTEMNELEDKIRIIEQSRVSDDKICLKAICENYIPKNFSKIKPTLESAYLYYEKK